MKNLAVALLLSLISVEEASAANQGTESLVQSTLATELDLKEFAVQEDHDKEDGSDSEEEDEDEEEGSEEEEEEEPKAKSNAKVAKKEAPAKNATSAASQLNHGRDSHGMFKNHPNYVHLRNKMNTQEMKHQPMFDIINEKLVDQDFFKKATHGHEPEVHNKTSHAHLSVVQKNSTDSPLGMNDEDAKCYSERYKDLNGTEPHDHYLTIGLEQGRLPTCAKNLSDIEAQNYLDRYPDLQEHLGRSGPGALMKARDHFVNHGFKEKRNVEPLVPNEFCGFSPNDTCHCSGTFWMGLAEANDTSAPIETLDHMRFFKTLSKSSNDSASCNPSEFGGKDPWPGKDKQCFCESAPVPKPARCADEGGNCLCKGTVIFGRKFGEDEKHELALEDMAEGTVALKKVNNSANLTCSVANIGEDPAPGHIKQCFCDDHSDYFDADELKDIENFWENKKAEEEAKAAEIKAKLELEKAEKEAAAKAAAAAEEARRQAAELEAARAKAEAEAQAAKAKAEAEAKAAEAAAAARKAEAEAKAKAEREEAERQKKIAEEKRIAAQKAEEEARKQKVEAMKQQLLKQAEEDKEEAIRAAVAASIAEQQAARDQEIAQLKAQMEREKIERERAQKEAAAAQAAEEAAAEAAAKQAREEEFAARLVAEAEKRRVEAEELKAAAEKNIAQALEQQKAAFEAKLAKMEAQKEKERQERERKEAEEAARKKREEELAEAAKKRAEEEAARKKAAAEAAEAALKAKQKAEEERKRKLEREAYEKAKAEQAAKDAIVRAQKMEELAKTQAEVQAAQAEAAKAQKALEDAEKERKAALEEKQNLLEEIERQEASARIAKQEAEEALKAQKKAQQNAANWKKLAEAAKKKAEEDKAKAEADAKKHQEELNRQREENKRKHAEALKAQHEAFAKAKAEAKAAHEAAEAARKKHEENQIAEHKRQMEARRASFEKKFRNVWATGPTGVSIVSYTAESRSQADDLISRLFKDTLVADVEEFVSPASRTFLKDHHMVVDQKDNEVRLQMLTSDDRVAELIEAVAESHPKSAAYPPFDMAVTPLASGNKEYIMWVQEQTMKRSGEAAFYNKKPEEAMKPLENRVDLNAANATVEAQHLAQEKAVDQDKNEESNEEEEDEDEEDEEEENEEQKK